MTIPESNWNNFFLLDLQKRLHKVLKKFETRINNHLNGLKNKIVLCNKKEHKVGLFDQLKWDILLFWMVLFGFADIWTGKMLCVGFAYS